MAEESNATGHPPEEPNATRHERKMETFKLDLVVSIRYGQQKLKGR